MVCHMSLNAGNSAFSFLPGLQPVQLQKLSRDVEFQNKKSMASQLSTPEMTKRVLDKNKEEHFLED